MARLLRDHAAAAVKSFLHVGKANQAGRRYLRTEGFPHCEIRGAVAGLAHQLAHRLTEVGGFWSGTKT